MKKCPRCGSEMSIGSPHDEIYIYQYECHNCGYIEGVSINEHINNIEWNPLSILQWIKLYFLSKSAIQYPKYCDTCRSKIKGNIVTGYYSPCRHDNRAEIVIV